MSKKWWLLIILIFIVVGWLAASKYVASVDPWIGENVGNPILTGIINTKNSITASSFWQMYIGPYTYIYTFAGGLIVMFFGYRWAASRKLPFQKPTVTAAQPMSTVVPQTVYTEPKVQPSTTPAPTPAPVETTPAQSEEKEKPQVVA